MNSPILECVPNFSEGRDANKIEAIAHEIRKVDGVKLLHVDVGYDANRTVITFAGTPLKVVEAAFNAAKKAAEIIDMRKHKGVHPRFGAIDVLPLIPVRNISIEETVVCARYLAKKIGNELGISVYCYEYAAFFEHRKNLANCRKGEYEGLSEKLSHPDWKPDFGPVTLNDKSGAIAIGARKFLLAYNVNLDTPDENIAKAIAATIRESGQKELINTNTGEKKQVQVPGKFKNLKAIGWYIPAYSKSQVSMNITDIDTTPMHQVFEEIKQLSELKGITVSGSELVGLLPLKALMEAGVYYNTVGKFGLQSENQLVNLAIEKLGLNDISPFIANERILEYCLGLG
jgi:glutamate formiminotransferase/formiminotetrahydrofolate cyclodeaminase